MSKFTGATPYEYIVKNRTRKDLQAPLNRKPPLTLAVAERVCRIARCALCGGSLMIERSEDPNGLGSLRCLACGHEAADVREAS